MAESPIGPEVTSEELARARRAFRGSLESSRAWRGFSTDPRHHDVTYWTLLTALFIEPGMNRMSLLERVIEFAGVSRSTAERAIREARQQGFIVDEPAGKEVRYRLAEPLFVHCIEFFRNFMDLERILAKLDAAGNRPGGRPG
jgi:hypothetical protein